jgi:hypothetical protein
MLITLPTDKTVSETAAALQAAVLANHFGVMQIHNIKETMAKKGVEFVRDTFAVTTAGRSFCQRPLKASQSAVAQG